MVGPTTRVCSCHLLPVIILPNKNEAPREYVYTGFPEILLFVFHVFIANFLDWKTHICFYMAFIESMSQLAHHRMFIEHLP